MIDKNIYNGYIIKGKWKNHKYKVIKLLGEGGIARVYKVKDIETNKIYALKLSDDLNSITKEYETLKKYEQLELFPRIREIDDIIFSEGTLYYLVMEYIEGNNLKKYIKGIKLKPRDIVGLAIIIGDVFMALHKNKYVFGDLKLENLMIDNNKKRLRIIDLGGVTSIGKGIKEYTPLYDRATWNEGLRRADDNYDLFSLNMLIVNLLLNSKLNVKGDSVENLIEKLKHVDISPVLVKLIHRGLKQKKISFEEYIKELNKIYISNECSICSQENNNLDIIINYTFIFSILVFFTVVIIFTVKNPILQGF